MDKAIPNFTKAVLFRKQHNSGIKLRLLGQQLLITGEGCIRITKYKMMKPCRAAESVSKIIDHCTSGKKCTFIRFNKSLICCKQFLDHRSSNGKLHKKAPSVISR